MHYLVTAFTDKREAVLIAIEASPADARFRGPLKCPVSASSRAFWRRYLSDYGVDSVTTVRPIQGYVPRKTA